ncbi:Major cardiolipin synthase ClsA [compost metagenome]
MSVGSTNFDNRSFRLNDEANLNVYDAVFSQRQTRVFEDDIQRSRRVTYEAWLDRPLREKAHEKMTGWLRSQL